MLLRNSTTPLRCALTMASFANCVIWAAAASIFSLSCREPLIRNAPRSWKELLQHFKGQNYRDVYRAFGRLRPKLGRVVQPPYYPYAFSESGDFIGETTPAPTAKCMKDIELKILAEFKMNQLTEPVMPDDPQR